MATTKPATVKQPADRLPKKTREYVVAEFEIEGERYPDVSSSGLKFSHMEKIETATGKELSEHSGTIRTALLVWLAVNAVVPTVSWDYFKDNTGVLDVGTLDAEGLTYDEWAKKYPEDAKAAREKAEVAPPKE